MASITTEAATSLHQPAELAVRLSPVAHKAESSSSSTSPAPSQHSSETPSVRSRPKKPAIPRHPISAMQDAFAESLAEVTSGSLALKPTLRADDAQTRRARLLDEDKSTGPPAALWRYRPGQNCHELRKLLAQIAFGVYLLLKGMANSNAQVVAILQGHIDEVDEFLKASMEDVDLAIQDITNRLDYLRLPLTNRHEFEVMLEDRNFRLRIVEGNVRIEQILSRTSTALMQSMRDVSEGLRAAKEFTTYLAEEEHGSWRNERPDVVDIYDAMHGNADGWLMAFADLEEKNNTLDVLVSKLADMVTEMDRCAGEVSRRTRFSVKPFTLPEEARRVSLASQSSHETTPPQSPGIHVPPAPPRLSLRFSTLADSLGTTFLDLGSRSSFFGGSGSNDSFLPTFQYTPPPEVPGAAESKTLEPLAKSTVATTYQLPSPPNTADTSQTATFSEQPRSKAEARTEADTAAATVNDITSTAAGEDLSSIPFRIEALDFTAEEPAEFGKVDGAEKQRAQGATDPSADEEPNEEEPLYLLQPRTYTPQPPTPLPSPVVQGPDRTSFSVAPLQLRAREDVVISQAHAVPVLERMSYRKPVAQTSTPNLRMVAATNWNRAGDHAADGTHGRESVLTASPSHSSGRSSSTVGQAPKKRASLRDRISLRTTPPDAIHVPPPDAPELQRPVFASPRTYQNYQTFTGPDTAYSSEADLNGSHRSFAEAPTSSIGSKQGKDMSPPVFPSMIPSPQSDKQCFRPVQASPHSPLQQRPHTAGQFPSRPHHLRNAPSSMGMSMLSSVTTVTQDSTATGSGRTLKKKRSALGWLKKAFTLDEDERAEFDQRKQVQERNLYYDGRSPKFLDGKRIR